MTKPTGEEQQKLDAELFNAVGAQDTPRAVRCLKAGANVNARDQEGQTPLHHAMSGEIARLLIDEGADVNARDKDGCTPIFEAARCDNLQVVNALVDAGADVKARDSQGRTPLCFAESAYVAALLIDKGADLGTKDNQGRSLWEYVEQPEVAAFLIAKGLSISAEDISSHPVIQETIKNAVIVLRAVERAQGGGHAAKEEQRRQKGPDWPPAPPFHAN